MEDIKTLEMIMTTSEDFLADIKAVLTISDSFKELLKKARETTKQLSKCYGNDFSNIDFYVDEFDFLDTDEIINHVTLNIYPDGFYFSFTAYSKYHNGLWRSEDFSYNEFLI